MDNIAHLICHPDTPSEAVREIIVSGDRGPAGFITLRYHLVGDVSRLHIPTPAKAERTEGLWSTTCFELFTRDEGDEAYREFNFSPSGQWAAYAFAGYREGMSEADVWAPRISVSIEDDALTADVTFVSPRLGPQRVGACVVIEEKDAAKSFWALAHPPGKPDFHHPACFAFELSAADGHMTENL